MRGVRGRGAGRVGQATGTGQEAGGRRPLGDGAEARERARERARGRRWIHGRTVEGGECVL